MIPTFDWDQNCPKCGSAMKLRFGKFGPFLGCTRYPDCKGIVNIPKKGEIPARRHAHLPRPRLRWQDGPARSRFGKTFFSCSNFPDCDVIVNNLDDLNEKYPTIPKPLMSRKSKRGQVRRKRSEEKKPPQKKRKKKPLQENSPPTTLSKELQADRRRKRALPP